MCPECSELPDQRWIAAPRAASAASITPSFIVGCAWIVRAIVGTLVDVGRGRYTPEDFRAIIASRDLSRSSAGVPAQGLFLSDVRYPAEIFTRTAYLDETLL